MKKNNNTSPDARAIALNVVSSVWDNDAYANIALNMELNKYALPDVERHFVTQLVYGSVKAGQVLDLFLQKFVTRPLKKIAPKILNILRLGIYQIFFLERIPDSAACNEAVKQARRFGHEGTVKFVNAVLRNAVRFKENSGLSADAQLQEAAFLQHPNWLVKRWQKQIGKDATKVLCEIDNKPAPMCLRTNTLKITTDKLAELFVQEAVDAVPSLLVSEGFVCRNNPSLAKLESFKKGFYQVQDESSMLVAHYLDVLPGQVVIDVCAAPGGKTTHIAALMQNKGRVLAADVHQHKLGIIKENSCRLGINIIETYLKDATVLESEWLQLADRVLVDAPCSGLGVLRRRPDLRWRKKEEDLPAFAKLQMGILNNASQYLRHGGKLVYSTCTTEEAENQGVIQEFLASNKDFIIEKIKHPKEDVYLDYLQLWPQIDDTDGFFICVLRKI